MTKTERFQQESLCFPINICTFAGSFLPLPPLDQQDDKGSIAIISSKINMEEIKSRIIKLPKIFDPRGSLTVVEENIHIPFSIQKISWKYGINPTKPVQGCTQDGFKFIVPLSGSFRVDLEDSLQSQEYMLKLPFQGLLIVPHTQYTIHDFSNGAVCLELSSI